MSAHHYTNTTVATAAVAVNGGACLEDADFENNVFSTIGQAVSQVCIVCIIDSVSQQVSFFVFTMHLYLWAVIK